jgi:hypothetical protein
LLHGYVQHPDFLHLESFSSRASGLLIFADIKSFGVAVLPFYLYLSRHEVGKKRFTTKIRVIYDVVTMAFDWARDYTVDIQQWPRRPHKFYKLPKMAIFRELYDFVDDIKGVEHRFPIAQHLVTMNAKSSKLEHSIGEGSSSGVSTSNSYDGDSPAERGKRRRRGQGGRRGK